MLCEKCKKNEAKINLVKIVNGEKQQIWLCEECAKNISNIPLMSPVGEENIFPFQEIINGLLSSAEKNIQKKEEKLVCNTCGLTVEEFNKTQKVGCEDCYKVFSNVIKANLKNNKVAIKHVGRIPKINGKELIQKNKLKNLKYELQILIEQEEYEKAAVIRDKIKEIELYILQSNLKGDEASQGEENLNGKLD